MRAIYITGGGKCGTHLVGAFLHVNWSNSVLHPVEFKTWRNDLPHYLTDRFIFHKPIPDIARFREICPNGTVLVIVRNPIQQYVAWLATYVQEFFEEPLGGKLAGMEQDARQRVLGAFDAAPHADAVWRLEDFANGPKKRMRMVARLLGEECLQIDAKVTVAKSRWGHGGGVQRITETEYPSILTEEEIAAFSRRDVDHAYPAWRDGLEFNKMSADECRRLRLRILLAEAQRRMLNRMARKGQQRHRRYRTLLLESPTVLADKVLTA